MPKFNFNSSFQLNDPLFKIGLRTAFKPNCDFERMIDDDQVQVCFDRILHETRLQFSDQGMEAVNSSIGNDQYAVSSSHSLSSIVDNDSEIQKIEDSFEMQLNRPFMVLIRHVESRAIIFVGKICNPTTNLGKQRPRSVSPPNKEQRITGSNADYSPKRNRTLMNSNVPSQVSHSVPVQQPIYPIPVQHSIAPIQNFNSISPEMDENRTQSDNNYTITSNPTGPICFTYRDSGNCRFGQYCRFSHSVTPNPTAISMVEVTPTGRTCFAYRDEGFCRFGDNCKYAHSKSLEQSVPKPIVSQPVIKMSSNSVFSLLDKKQIRCAAMSLTGGCTYGSDCSYSHDLTT